ncbi:unnamed protein product, partial [Meganyctiphanes norvegica]
MGPVFCMCSRLSHTLKNDGLTLNQDLHNIDLLGGQHSTRYYLLLQPALSFGTTDDVHKMANALDDVAKHPPLLPHSLAGPSSQYKIVVAAVVVPVPPTGTTTAAAAALFSHIVSLAFTTIQSAFAPVLTTMCELSHLLALTFTNLWTGNSNFAPFYTSSALTVAYQSSLSQPNSPLRFTILLIVLTQIVLTHDLKYSRSPSAFKNDLNSDSHMQKSSSLPPKNLLSPCLMFTTHSSVHSRKKNNFSKFDSGSRFLDLKLSLKKKCRSTYDQLEDSWSSILVREISFGCCHRPQQILIPLELEYDVRQYWSNKKKMRHQMSKRSMMDAPTNTIFTFIDRELTAQANDKDVTEVALAELYAYVHSLPDSAKKRRLIKQFNHASGPGTPTLNHTFQKKQRSLGDSIKCHVDRKILKNVKKLLLFSPNGSNFFFSEEFHPSPSSSRSSELRMFRRNPHTGTPDLLKAKSLDDLTSPNRSYMGFAPSTSSIDAALPSTVNPLFNPNSHYITNSKRSHLISNSSDILKDSLGFATPDNDGEPLSPLSIPPFTPENTYSALQMSNLTGIGNETPTASTFQFSKIDNNGKENATPWNSYGSTFTTPNATATPTNPNDADSPITQAVLRSSIPQMVIMTPRSRCPIIANSNSSLHNIPIPEETNENTSQKSPVIANPAAKFLSPEKPTYRPLIDSSNLVRKSTTSLHSIEEDGEDTIDSRSMGSMDELHVSKRSRWSGSSLRRTLSNASSTTTSLFGNFYRHLSTSSLVQLASRLTSHVTLPDQENDSNDEDMRQPDEFGSSEDMKIEQDESDALNQSLSNVFKSYLISRSVVLTDNPIDLSMDDISNDIEGECDLSYDSDGDDMGRDSAYDSQPSSISASREVSKASLISQDSALGLCKTDELSESLLYCLDGNNPLSSSASSSFIEEFQPGTDVSLLQENLETGENGDLFSCSPNGRRLSILKNKQGTPVRLQDKERNTSSGSARSVFFETSF